MRHVVEGRQLYSCETALGRVNTWNWILDPVRTALRHCTGNCADGQLYFLICLPVGAIEDISGHHACNSYLKLVSAHQGKGLMRMKSSITFRNWEWSFPFFSTALLAKTCKYGQQLSHFYICHWGPLHRDMPWRWYRFHGFHREKPRWQCTCQVSQTGS